MKWLLSFFPGLSAIRAYIYLAVGVFIISVVGLSYWHYNNLVNKLVTEKANNATLQLALQTQNETVKKSLEAIDKWEAAQKELKKTMEEMARISANARNDIRRLNETFGKHNLEELSLKRPELIQSHINSGTRDSLERLQCASGTKDPHCTDRDQDAGTSGSSETRTNNHTTGIVDSNHR